MTFISCILANKNLIVIGVDELNKALAAHPDAKRLWNKLPPSHKREYLKWIEGAKKPATRSSRVAKTIAVLEKKSS